VVKDGWVPQKINMLSKNVQYDSKVLNCVVFNGVQDEFNKKKFTIISFPRYHCKKLRPYFRRSIISVATPL
jgi:hypothetical protein